MHNIDSELNSNTSSSRIMDDHELEPIKFGKKPEKKNQNGPKFNGVT